MIWSEAKGLKSVNVPALQEKLKYVIYTWGLSIAFNLCAIYYFSLRYTYKPYLHSFSFFRVMSCQSAEGQAEKTDITKQLLLGVVPRRVRLADKWALAVDIGIYQFIKFFHLSGILSWIMYYSVQFNILYKCAIVFIYLYLKYRRSGCILKDNSLFVLLPMIGHNTENRDLVWWVVICLQGIIFYQEVKSEFVSLKNCLGFFLFFMSHL